MSVTRAGWIVLLSVLSLAESQARQTVGELIQKIELNKKTNQLPGLTQLTTAVPGPRREVVPLVSSGRFAAPRGSLEGQLEELTNEEIEQLGDLANRYANSSKRGEIWLRLAEAYVDKARIIEYQIQQRYDQAISKNTNGKAPVPKLDFGPAQKYNREAIKLYDWFRRDFPNDSKMDQALFFLGYNYFELGEVTRGESYYQDLSRRFPQSPYVDESNFTLGEYYFEKESWAKAAGFYRKVMVNDKSRLRDFATYKAAWCLYKTGQTQAAIGNLERVIRSGAAQAAPNGDGKDQLKLAGEALKDLVPFYATLATEKRVSAEAIVGSSRSYFLKVAGAKNQASMMETLAYIFMDRGQRSLAVPLFRHLIDSDPHAPRAFDYQYQVVSMRAGGNRSEYARELFRWNEEFSPGSVWYRANQDVKALVDRSQSLIEATLRNYILEQHQSAQNSRVRAVQISAQKGYEAYLSKFAHFPAAADMRFFYAELLFDMNQYDLSADQYLWVIKNAKKSPYYEKASLNLVLAIERKLPSDAEIKKIVGDSRKPVEFDQNVRKFVTAAENYFEVFPKANDGDSLRYRLASIYFLYNHFGQALTNYNQIAENSKDPKLFTAAALMVIETHRVQDDFNAMTLAAQRLLQLSHIAKSSVRQELQMVEQQASLKQAEFFEKKSDFATAANRYLQFANSNERSESQIVSLYNAAVNFERAGLRDDAIGAYRRMVDINDKKRSRETEKSLEALVRLYQECGQFENAAEAIELFVQRYPRDAKAANYILSAGLIREAFQAGPKAQRDFGLYQRLAPAAERDEAYFYQARVAQMQGQNQLARKLYHQYLGGRVSNSLHIIEAAFQLGELYQKAGKLKLAHDWYRNTIQTHKRLMTKAAQRSQGLKWVAEAHLHLAQPTLRDLKAIQLPKNPKLQAQLFQKKIQLNLKLQKDLETVIRLAEPEALLRALNWLADASLHLAEAIRSAPAPDGLSADDVKLYREGIAKEAAKFEEAGVASLEAGVRKGLELKVYSPHLMDLRLRLAEVKNLDHYAWFMEDNVNIYDLLPNQSQLGLDEIFKVLLKTPQKLEAWHALADHYWRKSMWGAFEIVLGRIRELNSRDDMLWLKQAALSGERREHQREFQNLTQALELNADSPVVSALSFSFLIQYQDSTRAELRREKLMEYLKKLSRGEVYNKLVNRLAIHAVNSGTEEQAIGMWESILKSSDTPVSSLVNCAMTLGHFSWPKYRSRLLDILDRISLRAADSGVSSRMQSMIARLKKKATS